MEIKLSRGGEGNAADFDISDVCSSIRADSRDDASDTGSPVAEELKTDHTDHNVRDHPHRIDCSGYTVRLSAYDDIRLHQEHRAKREAPSSNY